MFVALIFGIALLQDPSVQAGAQAQAAQTEAEREAAEREAEENEIVCRREHVVGTNRPQRICQTRQQWERLSDSSRQAMRDDRFQTGQGRGAGEGAD